MWYICSCNQNYDANFAPVPVANIIIKNPAFDVRVDITEYRLLMKTDNVKLLNSSKRMEARIRSPIGLGSIRHFVLS